MIYILQPVLRTPAIEKTDELLKVEGVDGYGSLTGLGGLVNCRSLMDRVNDTFAFVFALGGN